MNRVDIPPAKQSVTASSSILWGPVLLAFLSLITLGWLDNARGPLYPLILEGLSLNHVQGGAFFAVASFVAVLANFLVPALLRRMSSVSALLMGLTCMMIFVLGLSQTQSFTMLILSAVFFGLALGVVMVTINIVVEESVPKENQRSFLSVMHSLYGLAAFLSPILIGYILAWPVSWSYAFLPVLFVSVPLFIFGCVQKSRLRRGGRLESSLQNSIACAGAKAESGLLNSKYFTSEVSEPKKDHRDGSLDSEFDSKSVLVFWSLLLACYVSSELYFSTRMTILYQEGLGQSLEGARQFLSYFFLGLFMGRVINSILPVKIEGKGILVASFVCSILWMIFCVAFQPTWIWLMGFFMAPVYPVAVSEIAKQAGGDFKRLSSVAIAVSSFVVVLMHMLVGVVSDGWGLKMSMYIPVGFLVLGLGLVVTNWPQKKTSY